MQVCHQGITIYPYLHHLRVLLCDGVPLDMHLLYVSPSPGICDVADYYASLQSGHRCFDEQVMLSLWLECVRSMGSWGGQVELRALGNALNVHIAFFF